MKWNTPKHGDIRIKTFFAWLPIEIKHEVRWMERVKVKQEFYSLVSSGGFLRVGQIRNL